MKQLLFVCTGNTCRSPMAELYFNRFCLLRELSGARALSAGIAAVPGAPVSEPARRVLASAGVDAFGFGSRVLTAELIRASDLIVVMTESHRRRVLGLCPEAGTKCRLLLEFSGVSGPVPDPFGGTVEIYAAVFALMRPALEALAECFGATAC